MRVLLDEHLSPRIAQRLRDAGHDVVSTIEVGLRQQPDEEILRWAAQERRALVTRNVRDFRPLHARRLSRGEAHFGLIFLSASGLLSGKATGSVIRALDRLLQDHASDESLLSQEYWLAAPPQD